MNTATFLRRLSRPRTSSRFLPYKFPQTPSRLFSSTIQRASIPIITDLPPLRALRRTCTLTNSRYGFVPTMGALHAGHLSLVRAALKENTHVLVSIYVNPTQFGLNEDLASYPKTFEQDLKLLEDLQAEVQKSSIGEVGQIVGVFAPSTKVMYPVSGPSSVEGEAAEGCFVTVSPLGKVLEGKSRPVFFRGVATVCMKLFNAVQADRVYFGQKDVQQTVVVRKMVRELLLPLEVRVVETEREKDGLAMSSRNVFLGDRRRRDVSVLSRGLFEAKAQWDWGERKAGKLRRAVIEAFEKEFGGGVEGGYNVFWGSAKMEIDYVALTRPDDMVEIADSQDLESDTGAVLSAALKVSPVTDPKSQDEKEQISVRLIDNVILTPK